MDINGFNRILKSRYAPNYSFLRFESHELLDNFMMPSFIVNRGNQVIKISKEAQHNIYTNLCNEPIDNHVIGISGSPTDFLAMQTAMAVLYSQIQKSKTLDFEIVNSGFTKKAKYDNPKVVVIYNIIPEKERLYEIRDLLNRYSKSLRLVVVSGINAISYFDDYLRYPISGVMNVTATKNDNCYKFVQVKEDKNKVPIFDYNFNSLVENVRRTHSD